MRKILSIVSGILLAAPVTVFALGLGDIHTNSALNQAFDAEIDISAATPGEINDLRVTLGSEDAFDRAGIRRVFLLQQLNFEAKRRGDGSHYIHVTSREPIREPFLNFIVELDWLKGRLLREYTVLLDPPSLFSKSAPEPIEPPKQAAPAPVAQPAPPRPEPVPTPVAKKPVAPKPAKKGPTPSPVITPPGVIAESASLSGAGLDSYGPTKRNDTLWQIAELLAQPGVSHTQMMIALLRDNPQGFIGGNINQLKKGVILRAPERETLDTLTPADARRAYVAQLNEWQASRTVARADTQPGAADLGADGEAQVVASGDSADRGSDAEPGAAPIDAMADSAATASGAVGDAAPAPAPQATLELASAAAANADTAARNEIEGLRNELKQAQDDLMMSMEQSASAVEANTELSARAADLEAQLDSMTKLLSFKENQLALLQDRVTEAENSASEAAELARQAAAEADLQGEAAAAAQAAAKAAEAAQAASDAAAKEQAAAQLEAEQLLADAKAKATEAKQPIDEADAAAAVDRILDGLPNADDTSLQASVDDAAPVAAVGSEAPSEPEPAQAEVAAPASNESSVISEPAEVIRSEAVDQTGGALSGKTLWAVLGAGGIVLLTLLGLFVRRRQMESAEFGEPATAGVRSTQAGDSADLATPSQPTEDTSFLSDFSPSDIDAIQDDTGEVDPIAEADVYLAYGRYPQAEDLIKQALSENPDRMDLKHKLAEVYFSSKNTDAFDSLALEMQEAGIDQNDNHWKKLLAWGYELNPGNVMYSAAASGIGVVSGYADDPEAAAPTPDSLLASDVLGEMEDAGLESGLANELDSPSPSSVPETSLNLHADSDLDLRMEDDSALSLDLGDESILGAPDLEGESELALDLDVDSEMLMPDSLLALDASSEKLDTPTDEVPETDIPDLESASRALEDTDVDDFAGFALKDDESAASTAMAPPSGADELGLDFESIPIEDSLVPDNDETATKLDLAKAYIDMGDADGAKSILVEVLDEGSDNQRDEAKGLLDSVT